MYLRALRAHEYLRRCGHGSIRQEENYAGMRHIRRGLHGTDTCSVQNRPALRMAFVCGQCGLRTDEHSSAAGFGGGIHACHTEGTVSEDQRPAVIIQVSYLGRQSADCSCRVWDRRAGRSDHA